HIYYCNMTSKLVKYKFWFYELVTNLVGLPHSQVNYSAIGRGKIPKEGDAMNGGYHTCFFVFVNSWYRFMLKGHVLQLWIYRNRYRFIKCGHTMMASLHSILSYQEEMINDSLKPEYNGFELAKEMGNIIQEKEMVILLKNEILKKTSNNKSDWDTGSWFSQDLSIDREMKICYIQIISILEEKKRQLVYVLSWFSQIDFQIDQLTLQISLEGMRNWAKHESFSHKNQHPAKYMRKIAYYLDECVMPFKKGKFTLALNDNQTWDLIQLKTQNLEWFDGLSYILSDLFVKGLERIYLHIFSLIYNKLTKLPNLFGYLFGFIV
ncbi:hypothetical protein ACJX0J_029481, partial [Zea mays]